MSGAPPLRQNRGQDGAETEARRQGQDDVRSALAGLLGPLSRGRLIQNVPLASGSNEIAHGLGRLPLSWWLAAPQASVTVYESAARTSRVLTLTASAAATVDLVVV